MTPQDFIASIAEACAKMMAERPPKEFVVRRVDPNGQQHQQTATLPQLMAELSDHMRMNILQQREILEAQNELQESNEELLKAVKKLTSTTQKANGFT